MSYIVGKLQPVSDGNIATVERLDNYGNSALWVKVINNGETQPVNIRYKVLEGNLVANNYTVVDISDNIDGGVLRFINSDGSKPTGVLFIVDNTNNNKFALLPLESFEISKNIKQIVLLSTTNSHYQLIYGSTISQLS